MTSQKLSRRAVFLDRDGVLNEAIVRNGKPYPPSSIEELQVYADAEPALRRLKEAGFILIVVTNQPDVARGTQTREVVEAINVRIAQELPLDSFFVCWHDDADNCDCRKPKPGLLLSAAAQYNIDLGLSFMVGDRWKDVDAGVAAGCRTVFIDRQHIENAPESPDHATESLSAAVDWILGAR